MTLAEEWRTIVGHPDYEVSSLGRVRSWKAGNHGRRASAPHVLANRPDSKGYFRVNLCVYGGAILERFVHHLVLEHFVGPRPEGLEGRHANGNPTDNAPSNLKWSTHAENMDDQYAHGTRQRGESHWCVKLTAEQVGAIRKRLENGERAFRLAREYGVSPTAICKIRLRRHWAHVA